VCSSDLGICIGWQRLFPIHVLQSFESGLFGFHGSCAYLPYGRGRSPLNWSLIQGNKRFVNHCIRYDEKADSPNVFDRVAFALNEHDDIHTVVYKHIISAKKLIDSLFRAYHQGKIEIQTESKDPDFWYTKRGPEDGKIDFSQGTEAIYNLIRGVSRPFPGAFAFCGTERVLIWKAQPFDHILDLSAYAVGEVVDVLQGEAIVRTLDGSLLLVDYESACKLKVGDILE
jgi:methionyl-tRNA formyltransferase